MRAHLLAHLKPSLNSGCAVSVARSGTLSEAMLSICTAGLPVLADIPGTRVPRQRQGESPRSVPLPRAGRGTDEGGQRGDGHAGAQAKEGGHRRGWAPSPPSSPSAILPQKKKKKKKRAPMLRPSIAVGGSALCVLLEAVAAAAFVPHGAAANLYPAKNALRLPS